MRSEAGPGPPVAFSAISASASTCLRMLRGGRRKTDSRLTQSTRSRAWGRAEHQLHRRVSVLMISSAAM
jgi:hypothetical protein